MESPSLIVKETDDGTEGGLRQIGESVTIGMPTEFTTPWYRPMAQVSITQCDEEPVVNFTPYNLFCLQTRLQSFLIRTYPNLANATILFPMVASFDSVGNGGMMKVAVRLQVNAHRPHDTPSIPDGNLGDMGAMNGLGALSTLPDEKVLYTRDVARDAELPADQRREIQNTIDTIISSWPTHCLLDDVKINNGPGDQRNVPSSWLRVVLPYLRIDPELDPFIQDECLLVDLSAVFDYHTIYDQMVITMRRMLRRLYYQGTLVCSETFAQRWELVPVALGMLTYRSERSDESDLGPDFGAYQEPEMVSYTEEDVVDPDESFPFPQPAFDAKVSIGSSWSTRHRDTEDQQLDLGLGNDNADIRDQDTDPIDSGVDSTLDEYLTGRQRETTVGLYQARWRMDRYFDDRPKTSFLVDRLRHIEWIRINVDTLHDRELEIWHHVAVALRGVVDMNYVEFTGCGILIHQREIPDLATFRRVTDVTDRAALRGFVSDPVTIQRTKDLPEASEANPSSTEHTVVYRTTDRLRPYVTSVLSTPISSTPAVGSVVDSGMFIEWIADPQDLRLIALRSLRSPITGNRSLRSPITGNRSLRSPITGNRSLRSPITGNRLRYPIWTDTDRADGLVRCRYSKSAGRNVVTTATEQALAEISSLAYVPLVFNLTVDTNAVDRARSGQDDWLSALRTLVLELVRKWIEPQTTTVITAFIDTANPATTMIVMSPLNDDGPVWVAPEMLSSIQERFALDQLIGWRYISDDNLVWTAVKTIPGLVGSDEIKSHLGLIIGPGNTFPSLTILAIQSKIVMLRHLGYLVWSRLSQVDAIQVTDLIQELAPLWGFRIVETDLNGNLILQSLPARGVWTDEALGSWLCRAIASIMTSGLPSVTLTGEWVQAMNYDADTVIRLTYAARLTMADLASSKPYLSGEVYVNDDLSITAEFGTLDEVGVFLGRFHRSLQNAPSWLIIPLNLSGPYGLHDADIVLRKVVDRYPSLSPMVINDALVVNLDDKAHESASVAHPGLLMGSSINSVFVERPDDRKSQVDVISDLIVITGMDRERYALESDRSEASNGQSNSNEVGDGQSNGLVDVTDPQLDIYFQDGVVDPGLFVDMIYADGTVRSLAEVPINSTTSIESTADAITDDWTSGRYFNRWSQVMLSNLGHIGKQPIAFI
jgi:hypothetical protein